MKRSKQQLPSMDELIKSMKKAEFRNEHGELFNLYSNGITVLMSGDEVRAMVDPAKTIEGYIPLFNSSFNIWSAEELYKLGLALVELHKGAVNEN